LKKVVQSSASSTGYGKQVAKFANQGTIGKASTGIVWVKTYDPYISKVLVKLDGTAVLTKQQYPYSFSLNPNKLKAGSHKLEVIVYDSKSREASRKSFTFKTAG